MLDAIVGAVVAAGFFILIGAFLGAREQVKQLTIQNGQLNRDNNTLNETCMAFAAREQNFMQQPAIVKITNEQMELLGSLIAQAVAKHISALDPKLRPN